MLDYLRLASVHDWAMILAMAIASTAFLFLIGRALEKLCGSNAQPEPPTKKAISPEEGRRRKVREAILAVLSDKYSITRIQISNETPFFITAYDINSTLTELVDEGLVIIYPASPENVPDPEHSGGFDEIIKVKQAK